MSGMTLVKRLTTVGGGLQFDSDLVRDIELRDHLGSSIVIVNGDKKKCRKVDEGLSMRLDAIVDLNDCCHHKSVWGSAVTLNVPTMPLSPIHESIWRALIL